MYKLAKEKEKDTGIDPLQAGLIGTGIAGTGYMGYNLKKNMDKLKAPLTDANQNLASRIRAALDAGQDTTKLVNEAVKGGNDFNLKHIVKQLDLSGDEISKLTAGGYHADKLTAGQNFRALGSQTKGLFSGGIKGTAKNIGTALKKGLVEGGGGLVGGVGTKMRHLPIGAAAGTAAMAIPELAGAFDKEDPTGKGRSQTERVGRALGTIAGGVAGSVPHSVLNRLGGLGGMAGSLLVSGLGSAAGAEVLGGAGKLIDKGVSKLRGVEAGDVTHQRLADAKNFNKTIQPRTPGSKAV